MKQTLTLSARRLEVARASPTFRMRNCRRWPSEAEMVVEKDLHPVIAMLGLRNELVLARMVVVLVPELKMDTWMARASSSCPLLSASRRPVTLRSPDTKLATKEMLMVS